MVHLPLDDICSTYTQTLASSKTYIGIIAYTYYIRRNSLYILCIGYYGYIDQVELALTLEPTGWDYSTHTNDTMDPLIHSDRVLTDMTVLTLY